MERANLRLFAGCLVLSTAFPVHSQTSSAEKSEPATVVITGSRITSGGFSAPTPTTVLTCG